MRLGRFVVWPTGWSVDGANAVMMMEEGCEVASAEGGYDGRPGW